tara:strand:+ start:456 stop:821 length:366 start_codon:yes stop_codon:yes gene_type:complete
MNSDFENKLNRLRDLLSEHTGGEAVAQRGPTPSPDLKDPGTICPPDETGACCQQFGCVNGTMQADCEAGGGTFQGPGSTCEANPCDGMRPSEKITDVTTLIRDYASEDEAMPEAMPDQFMG